LKTIGARNQLFCDLAVSKFIGDEFTSRLRKHSLRRALQTVKCLPSFSFAI